MGLGPRQAGARVALLHGADHGPAAGQRLRPSVRPPRADAAGVGPPAPTPSEPDARKALLRAGGAVAGRGDVAGPGGVPPPARPALPSAGGRARRGGGAAAGAGGGVEGAGLRAPRGFLAAAGAGLRAPVAVRLGDLGAAAGRAAVRLPLPHRDLHARRPSDGSATTSCPSCSATSWSGGSISRPSGRCRRSWCGARTPSPACRTARSRRPWPASWRSWRSGSGSSR